MLDFLKRGKTSSNDTSKSGVLTRFKERLSRTREAFSEGLSSLWLGKKTLDAETFEALEECLLAADVGMDSTEAIIGDLEKRLKRKELADMEALRKALHQDLTALLSSCQKPFALPEQTPALLLMVGVNGAGKTTTLGKLAKHFKEDGKSVMLAAGDTFRAAAIEQLKVWGERNEVPVVAQHSGADSASVIFDAFQAAKARGVDVLLADTAGRLHTQDQLMEELKKVVRVIKKIDESAPHEILLVLDASVGQNALNQARSFHEDLGVSGLIVTKLDGTAKGGIVFNLAKSLSLPIYFIGIGEGSDDLRPFDPDMFVEALLS